ncbi:trypsin-like peptidase domain-containing protein [Porticoccaceae bacterium]|nr:trypsin-like peptidase domain-containing protein [Porticoccaceae bacterium]
MSKKDLRSELLSTTLTDDPFLSGCFRKYYPESKQEVIASESRSVYFVFTNVSIPSSNCDSSGNGVLESWSFSFPQLSSSTLPECPINDHIIWNNCVGTINYGDDKYIGEFKNDKRHGQGTYIFSHGDVYVGEFKNDKRHGQGTYTYSEGDQYEGEHKDNKWHGYGKFTFSNGDVYVGEFKNAKRHGQGAYTFSNGTISKGLWENDAFLGDVITNNYSEESLPTDNCPSNKNAEWHNCLGTYAYEDGTTYSGDWMSNKPHGQGNLIYPSGDKYSGSLKNGKRHGHGTYTYENGDMYAGDWKEGRASGNGVFSWANGDNYFGEFKDGKRHGQGNLVLSNGDNISGLWSNNEIVKDESLDGETTHQKNSKTDHKTIPVSSGTGFAITQNGHLVSNYHVIDGCQDVLLQLSNKDVHLNIIDHDSQNDIVLLKGDFYSNKFLPLSNEGIELLEDIYVAGYPFGDVLSSSVKVTKGIVSSLKGIGNNSSNFQIDAALQPGNSGGAIVNNKGNVIGVAVAKLDQKVILENFGVIPENTNFGIRTNVIKNMISANEITLPVENKRELQKKELGKNLSEATYLLSCRMTLTQIKKMESKKVMFENIKH